MHWDETVTESYDDKKDADKRADLAGPGIGDYDELIFMHAEDILGRFPDMPRKRLDTALLQEFPPFIVGIGWVLKDGYPMR